MADMAETERRLRTVENLVGPAGRLEALLNEGRPDAAYCALVCHPNPLGGGTMHNKVVYRAMKVLEGFGFPVLRFNFRGTGLSEGTHDKGRGEIDDAKAALDWLDHEFHRPILAAGFSFGAAVGLRAACGDPRVFALIALGLPIQVGQSQQQARDYRFLASSSQPKLFISGDHDEFGPKDMVQSAVASVRPPAELIFVEGADHFFTGKLDEMEDTLRDWLEELVGADQESTH